MSKSETYVKKTEDFLIKLQESMDFELVDVEFVKEAGEHYLRIYCDMDKDGGIGIDDCADISRAVSDWLDREDFIAESYILEVSSPGLGRTLKKDKDFERELGKDVDIKLFKARYFVKEFSGSLNAYDKETVSIKIGEEIITFNRNEIANIRLSIDF